MIKATYRAHEFVIRRIPTWALKTVFERAWNGPVIDALEVTTISHGGDLFGHVIPGTPEAIYLKPSLPPLVWP